MPNISSILKILDVPFRVIAGNAIRFVVIVGAMFTAFLGWMKFAYPSSQWPLPQGIMQAIWQSKISFVLFMGFATAGVFNPSRRLLTRSSKSDDEQRSNFLSMGIQRLHHSVGRLRKPEPITAWEMLLRAAELELEMALDLVGKNLIQTNLILANPPKAIVVVARSRVGPCPVTHKFESGRMACHAMQTNRTVVQCSVKKMAGFESKPYDCVSATPISNGKQAFGVITADSKSSTTFKGKEAIVDRVLRPYCAIVLLTLDSDTGYYDCPEHNAR